MKNISYYYFLFILLIINIENINLKTIKPYAFHHLEIKLDFSYFQKNKNMDFLISLLTEAVKILSKLLLSNNIEKISIDSKEISKCQELSSFKPLSDLDADVIIFPILVRQNINYKVKFCSYHKNNMPKIVILYIKQNINLNNYNENENYEMMLHTLKIMADSLGLDEANLKKKHIVRNNFFQTPYYLMGKIVSNSIEKLYKLTGEKIPKKNISLNGNFYKSTWNKDFIVKDFRNEQIDIKYDISESSMNLFNDISFYSTSKCEFEYLTTKKNKKCYLVNQECLNEKYFKSYYLSYGINQQKDNEIICYLSNSTNIKNNQCGKKYGKLLDETINICPLIRKNRVEPKIKNYEIPELIYYNNQTLNLLKPSPKCKSNALRTIYFKSFQRKENYSEKYDIETITLNRNQRKYFVTYLTKKESYFNVYVDIFKKNGLIRSYYHNNNHNLYIKRFEKGFFLKNNKKGDYLNKYQKIYHFIGNDLYYYKNILYQNYLNMKSHFEKDYNYMPLSYEYPKDAEKINQIFENYKLNIKDLWIVKPINLCSGKGIHIFKSLEEEKSLHKKYIISKYLSNPHLINGKKYDMRLYVLVTGFQPLRIYLYKEGLLRIAAEKYNLNLKSIENRYTHLTNTAVNINHKDYRKPKNNKDENSNEWYLHTYRAYLKSKKIDVDQIFDKIKDIMIKTIISGQQNITDITKKIKLNDMSMFNLFGFDIIIDNKYRPYLLEVNTRPSMEIYNNYDIIIKSNLFVDTLNIVGISPFSHEKKYHSFDKDLNYINNNIQNRVDNALCELTRPKGDYELIFPLKTNIDKYEKFFFKNACEENTLFWKEIKNNL